MRIHLRFAACALMLLTLSPLLRAATVKGPEWFVSYDRAMTEARRQNRLVMAYFCGSDWDPWCQKLDAEVLDTPMFLDWARDNVVLLRVDFPRETRISATLALQNDQLKERFSVSRTPTVVFLDPWGEAIARAGYDDLKKLKEERRGEPKSALAYLRKVIAERPPDQTIDRQPGFNAAVAKAKSVYGVLVLAVTHGKLAYALRERDELLRDQQFVKFINANVTFVQIDWPDDSDTSPDAQAFRAFAAQQKIAPLSFQLIVLDVPFHRVKGRFFTYDPNHVERLIAKIQAQLPHIDYTNGWITDYNTAKTIAAQQERYIFVAFTSMDGGDWSKRMQRELFDTPEFKKYARKYLVLVQIDFPHTATQPEAEAARNRMLADLFNIRGFPTVVVVNPTGQKLVQARYMAGGPSVFLSELDPIIQNDIQRQNALKD